MEFLTKNEIEKEEVENNNCNTDNNNQDLNQINIKTDDEASCKSGSLNESLESQVDKFYNSNKQKFIQSAKILNEDNSEINNEESFKVIYRFSKKQTNKLESKLNKAELPKSKHNFIKNGNERLSNILNLRHLKNRKIYSSDDSDFDQDEEKNNDENCKNKINLNETLSKRLNEYNEKLNLKKNLIKHMYQKSIENQQKSKNLKCLSSLENLLKLNEALNNNRPKLARPKTSDVKSDYEKLIKREPVEEKLNFDVSRNYSAQNYSFRFSKNLLNSQIEVFKPTQYNKSLLSRPKTSIPILSNNSLNKLNRSQSFQSNTKKQQTAQNEVQYFATKNVSINMEQVIKNSKILESKCLSTFWMNYI